MGVGLGSEMQDEAWVARDGNGHGALAVNRQPEALMIAMGSDANPAAG